MIVQFEAETDAKRSSDIGITVGTVGYYTNLKAFLYEYADPEAVDNDIRAQIDGYILKANALKPETDYQKKLRGKMLVYYSNLKEHFDELTTDEKTEVEGGLYATYCEYMEEYRFAEIKQTRFIMSFGIISDTHITNYNNTSYLEGAMRDMLKLDPDLAAMFHLGDMSDSGGFLAGQSKYRSQIIITITSRHHKPTNSRGDANPRHQRHGQPRCPRPSVGRISFRLPIRSPSRCISLGRGSTPSALTGG